MPQSSASKTTRPRDAVLYTVAILFVTIPAVHSLIQLWPLRMFDIRWRFDAANALSLQLMMPFLGLSFDGAVGSRRRRTGLSRALSVRLSRVRDRPAWLLVLFAMDALQLKTIVNSSQEKIFEQTSQRIVFSTVIFSVAYSILMLTAFKSTRVVSATSRKARKAKRARG
jgi:hypothetical protein